MTHHGKYFLMEKGSRYKRNLSQNPHEDPQSSALPVNDTGMDGCSKRSLEKPKSRRKTFRHKSLRKESVCSPQSHSRVSKKIHSLTHSFIHSLFNKYMLRTHYVLGIVLGPRDLTRSKVMRVTPSESSWRDKGDKRGWHT